MHASLSRPNVFTESLGETVARTKPVPMTIVAIDMSWDATMRFAFRLLVSLIAASAFLGMLIGGAIVIVLALTRS